MKKKLFAALLTAALTVSMSVPAFAEIIWTPDKLPEGYTTNEWENKDFSAKSGTAVKKDTYTYYIKDLHGNIMKDAAFSGEVKTNLEGIIVRPDGTLISYGSEAAWIAAPLDNEKDEWHQDTNKPLNNNGVSNWWYGTLSGGFSSTARWIWIGDGAYDGTKEMYDYTYIDYTGKEVTRNVSYKHVYCFNEYGYLYINTITPDGFLVNELGQLIIDGKPMVRRGNELNRYHYYSDAPIGYLVYDEATDEKHKDISFANPYF